MIQRFGFAPPALIALIALVAAGALGPSPPALARPAAMPVKTFCERFELAELDQRLGACPGASAADPSVAKLKEAATRARHQCIELINSGASQSRLRFNGSAADACIAAQTALMGDPTRSHAHRDAVRSACAGVVIGLVAGGKACESSLDCRDGLACIGPKGAPPGVCTARLSAGQSCDDEQLGNSRFYQIATARRSACGDALHCSAAGGELKCARNLAEGQPSTNSDGASECGSGLRCALGHCAAETRAGANQVCVETSDCAVGLYCQGGGCVAAKPAGAACSSDDECKGTCRKNRCAALCSSG